MKRRTILAVGADIKNRFLLANNGSFYFGPDIGDLSEAENLRCFKDEIRKITKRYRPGIVACDLHPNYFSSYLAEEYASQFRGCTVHRVQHHHAHIASVMCEHGIDRSVIGISFDGTGYGTDTNIWGGEFLVVSRGGFRRHAHFKYLMMPGSEVVVRQPWRMLLSILGREGVALLKRIRKDEKDIVLSMMAGNINSPLTSSVARLFDAAAALLGLCERASFEAEGPIKLEAICKEKERRHYRYNTSRQNGTIVIDTQPIFSAMANDLRRRIDMSTISSKFHNSIVDIIVKTVGKISSDTGIRDIALSGGVFQNRYLTKKTTQDLTSRKFKVYINKKLPASDLNISLGQYHVSLGAEKD